MRPQNMGFHVSTFHVLLDSKPRQFCVVVFRLRPVKEAVLYRGSRRGSRQGQQQPPIQQRRSSRQQQRHDPQSLHIAPHRAPPRPTRARPGWINFYCTISLSRYDRRPLSARLHHTPRRHDHDANFPRHSYITYMHLDHESGERRRAGFLQEKSQQKRWQIQCKRDELLQRWWLSSREW